MPLAGRGRHGIVARNVFSARNVKVSMKRVNPDGFFGLFPRKKRKKEKPSRVFSSFSLLVDPVVGLELEHLADGDRLTLVAEGEAAELGHIRKLLAADDPLGLDPDHGEAT